MNSLAKKIVLCFLLCLCLWLGGLLWFIKQIPTQPSTDDTSTDAIIVLTGGSGRLEYGLQLLAEGKGEKLFISGVHDNITAKSLINRATPEIRNQLPADAQNNIILGHEAENTIGNAEETTRWLKEQGYTSIRLVTANYHMPRSLEEFEELAPELTIIPEPVFPDDFNLNRWWASTESRVLLLSEYHKFVASKLRHLIVSVTHHTHHP